MRNFTRCIRPSLLIIICLSAAIIGGQYYIGLDQTTETQNVLPDTASQYETTKPETEVSAQIFKRRRSGSGHNNIRPSSRSSAIPDYIRNWSNKSSSESDVFGQDSGLWEWSPAASHHKSVVRIHIHKKKGTKTVWYMGTGVIIAINGDQYEIITCAHVVSGAEGFVVGFSDGGIAVEGETLSELSTMESDTALISIPIPENSQLKPVKIADNSPIMGERVECCGYGGSSRALRTFYAESGPMTSRQRTIVYQSFAPGDSGGPVFNDKQELVGLMSRAAIDWWHPDPALVYRGREVKLAWPGLFVGLRPINGAIKVRK